MTTTKAISKIGIYAGGGTSHSWLWFVDLFENKGLHTLAFLNESDVQKGLDDLDVLVISGGDTFAVAEALGPSGADSIGRFVQRGGLYIGSCAGAYLPMKSSKKPLDLFNFVDVKITNLSKILPATVKESFKFCTSYGCDFIFHPVREEISLRSSNSVLPFCPLTFTAPLYGGPGMTVTDPSLVLATYHGFTTHTSFLVSEALAGEILLEKAAVVRVPMGKGLFYLFGPHLEHPKYPLANQFVSDVINWETRPLECPESPAPFSHREITPLKELSGKKKKTFVMDIKRELSNSRIVAVNLEFLPIRWMIGKKVYEPEKVRVFLESMWSRIKSLERMDRLRVFSGDLETIRAVSVKVTQGLRRLKRAVDDNQDSLPGATEIFSWLQQLSMAFYTMYFLTLTHEDNRPPPSVKIRQSLTSANHHNRRVNCKLDQ